MVRDFVLKIKEKYLHYVKEFTEVTSLHGMKYLSMSNLHFLEIFFWLLLLIGSVYGASNLIGNNWQRYNENPTVIAIEKNYKEWNITFPAATFCFVDNLDVTRAKQFIYETWGVQPGPNDKDGDEGDGFPFGNSGSESGSDSGTEASSNAGSENNTGSGSAGNPDSGSQGSSATGSQDSSDSGSESNSDSGSEAASNYGSDTNSDSVSEDSSNSAPEGNSDTGSESNSDSAPDGNSDSAPEQTTHSVELNSDNAPTNVPPTTTTAGPEPSKYLYYLNFLRTLANTSYDNLHVFREYENDETLKNLNLKETVLQVIRVFRQNSTFYTKDFKDRQFFLTPTEMGMCHTHGGKLADYITLSDTPNIRHDLQLPVCTFENNLCYARTEGTPSDIRYYIHTPYDIPDTSSGWFLIKGRMGRDVSFTVLETTVSPEIYDLSPSQRKCRFMFEPTDSHMRVYSFNLCRMQCRKRLAYRMCGCAPYFYVKEAQIPICGLEGLVCLSRYARILNTLKTDLGEKLICDCLPQCIDSKYFVDKDVIQQWSFPAPYDIRFRWAVEKFSKIRLRRDVIFSYQDLVVSFGGTAALFLGCSVLSFVEIVYFFTIRLFWFIRWQKKKKKRKKENTDKERKM